MPVIAIALLLNQAALKPYTLAPGFRISLPAPPSARPAKTTAHGAKVMSWISKAPDGLFVATASTLPHGMMGATPSSTMLGKFVEGYVRKGNGTLLEKQTIKVDGLMGVEALTKSATGIQSRLRVFALGDVLYEVAGASRPNEKPPASTRAVLDSIHIAH